MAFAYQDWMSQPTDAARLERLRLHHAEVSAGAGGASISGDGRSRSPEPVHGYLDYLTAQIEKLERRLGVPSSGAGIMRVDLRGSH